MSERRTYKVTATPEGKWWVISIEGLPEGLVGVTQAESEGEIEEMARECIALLLDVDAASFDVKIDKESEG